MPPLPRSPTVNSSSSPIRHSTSRSMTSRSQPRHLSNVPGIINLPLSKSFDTRSTHSDASSNGSSTRHRLPASQPRKEKPMPTLDGQSLSPLEEPKKRRRAKKTPAANAAASLSSELDGGAATTSVDDNGVDHSTPTKSRRRRGRATRQTSPPLPDLGDSLEPSSSTNFTSSTPPQADLGFPLHSHSRSVPPQLPTQAHHSNSSSGEEWDMPMTSLGKAAVTEKPKENLSWQQQLLKSAPQASPRSRDPKSDSPRPARSRNTVPPAQRAPNNHNNHLAVSSKPPRPALHTSVSDSASTTQSNPSLNWQQAMLLSSDLQTSALNERRVHSASPTKPSPSLHPPNSAPTMTPARQRQHRIKDSITFGLSDLDTSEFDTELEPSETNFQSPVSRHNSVRRNTRPSPPSVEFSTPTKQDLASLEPRYAGPTFHNSPAPSSLPVPSFVLRRQV